MVTTIQTRNLLNHALLMQNLQGIIQERKTSDLNYGKSRFPLKLKKKHALLASITDEISSTLLLNIYSTIPFSSYSVPTSNYSYSIIHFMVPFPWLHVASNLKMLYSLKGPMIRVPASTRCGRRPCSSYLQWNWMLINEAYICNKSRLTNQCIKKLWITKCVTDLAYRG